MPTLNEYSKEVQVLLREQKQELINPEDITRFINRARRDIAMRTQCVRIITPISSGIMSASVILSGSGYTGATVGISAPDFPSGVAPNPNGLQATATAVLSSGTISSVSITGIGDGYFQPQASIVGNGTGASVTLQTEPINVLKQGQEVYPFSNVVLNSFTSPDTAAGVSEIYYVRSVSIIYANYRYSLPRYSFSTYQSMIRQYPFQYQYVPTFCSQYGQGSGGSFYVYPLPSQTYQYELDCFCIPSNLTTNTSVEAIPDPWTDAVSYLACAHGMMSMQNYNAAQFYKTWYDEFVQRYSDYARAGHIINSYGRY